MPYRQVWGGGYGMDTLFAVVKLSGSIRIALPERAVRRTRETGQTYQNIVPIRPLHGNTASSRAAVAYRLSGFHQDTRLFRNHSRYSRKTDSHSGRILMDSTIRPVPSSLPGYADRLRFHSGNGRKTFGQGGQRLPKTGKLTAENEKTPENRNAGRKTLPYMCKK